MRGGCEAQRFLMAAASGPERQATALVVLGDALQRVSFMEPFGTPYVVWPSPF